MDSRVQLGLVSGGTGEEGSDGRGRWWWSQGGVRQWWVSADDDGNGPLSMLGFVGVAVTMSFDDYSDHKRFRWMTGNQRWMVGWCCGSATVAPLEPWATNGTGGAELDERGLGGGRRSGGRGRREENNDYRVCRALAGSY
jgi:hypothetical protein